MKNKHIILALLTLSGCQSNSLPIVWGNGNTGSGMVPAAVGEAKDNAASVVDDGVFRTDKTILSYMPEGKGCRFKQSYGYTEAGKYSETDSRELFVDLPCTGFDFKNYTKYLLEKRVKNTLKLSESKNDDKMFVSFNQEGNNCIIDFSAGVAENGKYRETDIKQVTFGARECKGIIDDFILGNSHWIGEKQIKQPIKNWNFADKELKKEAGKTDKTVVSLKQTGSNCVYSRSYGWSLNGKYTETDFKQITLGKTLCTYVHSLAKSKSNQLNKDIASLETEMERVKLQLSSAPKDKKEIYSGKLRELGMKISALKSENEAFVFGGLENEMNLKTVKQPLVK